MLVRRIADYDAERSLSAWLAGIARRVAARHRQRPRVPPQITAARARILSVIRRHHARERRSFVLLPRLALPGTGSWALGGLGLGLLTTIAAARCWVGGPDSSPAVLDAPGAERVELRQTNATPIPVRDSDPANAPTHAHATNDAAWQPAGHGFSILAGGTLSHERRYRLDGPTLTFETTYLADADVDTSIYGHIELDGLEPIAGELEWRESIVAEQTRVRQLQANASREGVVSLRLIHTHAGGGESSTEFRWLHEGGVLRRCGEHECEPPPAVRELLSGSTIEVELINTCSQRVEFVLLAGPGDRQPPEHIAVHSLEPSERRRATIDTAQWIRRRSADGRAGGGVRTDSPGAVIRFFENGGAQDCGGLSTSDLPPA